MPDVTLASLDAHSRLLLDKAQVALARGQADYAVEVCGWILGQHPGSLEVRQLWIHALRQASAVPPPRLRRLAARIRCWLLRLRGEPRVRSRLVAWDHVLQLDPCSTEAWRGLARGASQHRLVEVSVLIWQQLCALEPRHGANWVALARACLDARRWSEAVAAAERALEVSPADRAAEDVLRRAAVADTLERGRWERGGTFHDKLRPTAPSEQAQVPPDVAKTEAAEGVPASAEERLTRALTRAAQQPHDPEAQVQLGQAYLEHGDAPRALQAFQRAQGHPRTWAAASIGSAEALHRQGLYDLAVRQLHETRATLRPSDPRWTEATYLLGLGLAAQRNESAAQAEFREVYRVAADYRDVAARILNPTTGEPVSVPPARATSPSTAG